MLRNAMGENWQNNWVIEFFGKIPNENSVCKGKVLRDMVHAAEKINIILVTFLFICRCETKKKASMSKKAIDNHCQRQCDAVERVSGGYENVITK